MDRRRFLHASGVMLGSFLPAISSIVEAADLAPYSPFEWSTEFLKFSFTLSAGQLRQGRCVPMGTPLGQGASASNGVEVALQCTGESWPDPGMKSAVGMPGIRLQFVGKREEPTPNGQRLTLSHRDSMLSLRVESVYEAFTNAPMVRRQTKITNDGKAPVGIDFLSSAMLHGLADPQHFDGELRIHLAVNSWMAEGQWHTFRPSELGFVENERTSWSEASADSVGSWSTEKYLPMAIVENTHLGLVWFWQIEHDGSWYWEISNVSARGNSANDVYAYLGGPDDLHADAWKNLQPGQSYMRPYQLPLDALRGTSRMRWMPSQFIAGLPASALARAAIGARSSLTIT